MPKAYSFFKNRATEEKHIFEGETTKDSCSANPKSICKKITRDDNLWITNATCLNEVLARKKASELGRSVCGTCVSHLYTSY